MEYKRGNLFIGIVYSDSARGVGWLPEDHDDGIGAALGLNAEWFERFHDYSLVWTSRFMDFFVDGKLVQSVPIEELDELAKPLNPYSANNPIPLLMRLNVAIPPQIEWEGAGLHQFEWAAHSFTPIEWPVTMEVDYVRYFAMAPSSPPQTLLRVLPSTRLPTLSPTLLPTLSPPLSPTLSPTLSPMLSPTLLPTLSPVQSPPPPQLLPVPVPMPVPAPQQPAAMPPQLLPAGITLLLSGIAALSVLILLFWAPLQRSSCFVATLGTRLRSKRSRGKQYENVTFTSALSAPETGTNEDVFFSQQHELMTDNRTTSALAAVERGTDGRFLFSQGKQYEAMVGPSRQAAPHEQAAPQITGTDGASVIRL